VETLGRGKIEIRREKAKRARVEDGRGRRRGDPRKKKKRAKKAPNSQTLGRRAIIEIQAVNPSRAEASRMARMMMMMIAELQLRQIIRKGGEEAGGGAQQTRV
jgi:hypothetical protein